MMRRAVTLLAVIALLAAFVPSEAWAHRRVVRSGFSTHVFVGPYWGPYWGPRYWWDPFWYPPAYVAPPIVVREEPPPVYIQQQPAQAQPSSYWYYCESAKAYYPYVRECPAGWLKVVPSQPAQ